MFDGFDCCGYDSNGDGDYDDQDYYYEFAPGDTALCTECQCKGMSKFEKSITRLEKKLQRFEIHCDRLDENELILMKLHHK